MTLARLYLIIFCLCTCFTLSFSQSKAGQKPKSANVFFIGEDEKTYEGLVKNYNHMLFTVCNNNMELAFEHWSILLKDIEDYAQKAGIDLKGVKLWLNIFWAKDGTIDHIVFYPKPNSKNMNYDTVKSMLVNFSSTYQSALKHTAGYSHYGSAAFPIFSKAMIGPEK